MKITITNSEVQKYMNFMKEHGIGHCMHIYKTGFSRFYFWKDNRRTKPSLESLIEAGQFLWVRTHDIQLDKRKRRSSKQINADILEQFRLKEETLHSLLPQVKEANSLYAMSNLSASQGPERRGKL